MQHAGLCLTCAHVRPIESSKGSAFILCELSKSDPRFPKYPRLPVLNCPGFRQSATPERHPETSDQDV
jgi:hypothetical protein